MDEPFPASLISPADVAVPLSVKDRLPPDVAVGRAMDCTKAPAGVYSSRKTWVAALVSAAVPAVPAVPEVEVPATPPTR